MNFGTRLRTALFIITFLNQANVSLGVWEFGDERINVIYRVFSYLLSLLAGGAALWYNNDFTPEAAQGTGLTRHLKAEARGEEDGLDIVIEDYIKEGDEDEPDEL